MLCYIFCDCGKFVYFYVHFLHLLSTKIQNGRAVLNGMSLIVLIASYMQKTL